MNDEQATPEASAVQEQPAPPEAPAPEPGPPEVPQAPGDAAAALAVDQPAPEAPAPEPATPAVSDQATMADDDETVEETTLDEPAVQEAAAPPAAAAEPPPSNKRWYVVKVQSGREESIKEAIERKVKIEGLEEFYGQIIIPVEKVVEMRNNKRVTRERKLYPGYLMCEVEFNDRVLYLFRETSGVGDFVGGNILRNQPPTPMSAREVERMLGKQGQPATAEAKPGKAPVERGDRVKVKDGTFAGMEGEVKDVIEAKGLVRVELTIFGRPVPVELEYWQVERV